MVVAWCRIRNMFLMMSTVVIVSAEQTGSSVCFCSAVTFACSEKLSQHQITPKDFQNKVFPQLDREDNLYYEDDEKIQWKARSVSIPPNKISLFLQDLRHALKRCQARLKFKEQRAVLTGWLFFFFPAQSSDLDNTEQLRQHEKNRGTYCNTATAFSDIL